MDIKFDALDAAIAAMENKYGKGSIMTGATKVDVKRLRTGSLGLDITTGGGWGAGRMIELYGPESSGKTTLTIHTMVAAQKDFPDKKVAFIDAEHALDRQYATALGLNVDDMIISQPDNGEQALEIAEALISSGQISVCVIDSVAALTPKAEIEGEMGDSKMGLHARLMSQACRKLTGVVSKSDTLLMWTNQLREKIGVMFGSPEVTTGGNALKFYASIRVDIRRKAGDKDKEGNILHNNVTAKTIKNKLAPPFQVTNFDIVFGEGISLVSEILVIGEEIGLLKKSGAWYSYEGTKIGNGAAASKQMLKDNPELCSELELKIRQHFNIT